MAGGSFSYEINAQGYALRVDWSATPSMILSDNYSNFNMKVYLVCPYALHVSARSGNEMRVDGSTFTYNAPKIDVTSYDTIKLGECSTKVTHNIDGSKSAYIYASYKLNATIGGKYYTQVSVGKTVTFDKIPRNPYLTSATSFNDEGNPTIEYTNPIGSSISKLEACIASSSGGTVYVSYREVDKSSKSYKFSLTSSERNTLRNACKNAKSMTVRFYLRTTFSDGTTDSDSMAKTFSIVNAKPTIATTVIDSDEKTTALTGNSNTVIKGYSNLQYTITAEALKNATIKSYKAVCGSVSSTNAADTLFNVDSNAVSLSVTDSRGYTTTEDYLLPTIEYFDVTCNQDVQIELTNEIEATVALTITGNYFNQSFGAANNELFLEVRHTDNDGNMGDWVVLTEGLIPEFDGNKYTLTTTITGFKYDRAYTFQCRATDKLSFAQTGEYTVKLIPVFDWSKEDFNFNVPIMMNGETVLRYNTDAKNVVLSAGGGFIYFRQGGTNDNSTDVKITPQGNIELDGDIIIGGQSLKSLLGID